MNSQNLGVRTLIYFIYQKVIFSFLLLILAVFLPNISQFFIKILNLNLSLATEMMINRGGNILVAILFILFVIAFLFGIISALLKYFGTRYSLEDYAFRYRRGIISKNEISIPYKHIENVDVQQSIFFRILGLSKLVIFSSGSPDKEGDSADEVFQIIDAEKAQFLKTYLLKKSEIEEVVEVKNA